MMVIYLSVVFFFQFLDGKSIKVIGNGNVVDKMPFFRNRRQTCESYKCYISQLTCLDHAFCQNCCQSGDFECRDDICQYAPGGPIHKKDQAAKREDPEAKRMFPIAKVKDSAAKIKDQAAKIKDQAAKREVIGNGNVVDKMPFLRNRRQTCESYKCYISQLTCLKHDFCQNCCQSVDFECSGGICHYSPGGPSGRKDQVARGEYPTTQIKDPVAKRKYPTTQIKDQAAKIVDSAAKREDHSYAVEKFPFLRNRRQICESYKCTLGSLTCLDNGFCQSCCDSSDYECDKGICYYSASEPIIVNDLAIDKV